MNAFLNGLCTLAHRRRLSTLVDKADCFVPAPEADRDNYDPTRDLDARSRDPAWWRARAVSRRAPGMTDLIPPLSLDGGWPPTRRPVAPSPRDEELASSYERIAAVLEAGGSPPVDAADHLKPSIG